MRTRGDRKELKDYAVTVPYDRPVPVFSAGADPRAAALRKLLEKTGIEDDMQEVAEVMLQWIELMLSAKFSPEIVGR